MTFTRPIRAVAAGAVLCAGVLAAGEAEAAYAAIAFSQTSGAAGYWYGAASEGAAEDRALGQCGSGCSVVIWTRDACAALAVGAGNGYGSYWSTSRSGAINGAINECAARTSGCRLNTIVCSGN